MRLIHLPTLDGSTESAVARLEALGRQHDVSAVEDGIWQAGNLFDSMLEVVSPSRDCQEEASRLRANHEAVLTEVQREIDRLLEGRAT